MIESTAPQEARRIDRHTRKLVKVLIGLNRTEARVAQFSIGQKISPREAIILMLFLWTQMSLRWSNLLVRLAVRGVRGGQFPHSRVLLAALFLPSLQQPPSLALTFELVEISY